MQTGFIREQLLLIPKTSERGLTNPCSIGEKRGENFFANIEACFTVIDTGNRSLSNRHLCPINRIVSAQLKVGGTESTIPPARVNLIPSPFDHYTPLKRYVTTRRAVFIVSQALNVKSHLSVETSAKLFRSKTTLPFPSLLTPRQTSREPARIRIEIADHGNMIVTMLRLQPCLNL